MDQKWLLVRGDAGARFEPLLGDRERARPWRDFNENSIEQREDVEPPKSGVATRHRIAENHPEHPDDMEGKNGYRE